MEMIKHGKSRLRQTLINLKVKKKIRFNFLPYTCQNTQECLEFCSELSFEILYMLRINHTWPSQFFQQEK